MAMCVADPWTGTVGCVSDDTFLGSWEEVRERLESCSECAQCWPLQPEITADLVARAWKDLEAWFGIGVRGELVKTTPEEIVKIWLEL